MPPVAVLIMLAGTVATVAIIKTIASTILRFKEQAMRESLPPTVSDERLARIEAAVEAIAIEVERISEGQRFTTKLLSEQTSPVQAAFLPKPGKFDTPH